MSLFAQQYQAVRAASAGIIIWRFLTIPVNLAVYLVRRFGFGQQQVQLWLTTPENFSTRSCTKNFLCKIYRARTKIHEMPVNSCEFWARGGLNFLILVVFLCSCDFFLILVVRLCAWVLRASWLVWALALFGRPHSPGPAVQLQLARYRWGLAGSLPVWAWPSSTRAAWPFSVSPLLAWSLARLCGYFKVDRGPRPAPL